jgi:hypothetical protein
MRDDVDMIENVRERKGGEGKGWGGLYIIMINQDRGGN